MERQQNSSLVGRLGCGFDPEPTPWISKKHCALQINRGGFAKAGIRSLPQAMPQKTKGLKKKYKETVDNLSHSGVGVESDKDIDDLDLTVSYKWFTEIHGVLGRRVVVSPPSPIDSSNVSTQHSGTSTPAVDAGQSSSTDQTVSLTPTNTGEIVQLATAAATESEDLIKPRTRAADQPDLEPPQLYQLNTTFH